MNKRVQEFRNRKHLPRTIVAPSGEEYVIQRLTAMDYIKEGLTDIPNDFFKFVFSLQSGKKSGMTEEEEKKNYELFEKYLSITLSKGIIEPPVILRYDAEKADTHLLWQEIDEHDQEYLVGCIMGRIKGYDAEVDESKEGSEAQGTGTPTE